MTKTAKAVTLEKIASRMELLPEKKGELEQAQTSSDCKKIIKFITKIVKELNDMEKESPSDVAGM